MSETAAQLVDHVLPHVPVRQWVLSLPHFLRYRVAYDAALCSEALAIFLDEVFRWYRWEGKRECGLASVADAHAGSVTWIQRFSSSLALNVHFHALVLDGVYLADSASSKPVFRALAAPTQADMLEVVARVHRRVIGLLHKRGLLEDGAPDDLVEAEPLLAACAMASIQGRVAQGERAGSAVERLRTATPVPRSIGTRCVEFEGFNLHANVRIPASERSRLERLCRYVGRPPLANERLGPLSDGRIGYRLKRPWSDGTTFVVFGRQALIEKLVALVPPPRVHQIRYHGVLASHARLRPLIVPEGPERCAVARQQDGCRHYSKVPADDRSARGDVFV
jgi:hypothetical protein